MDIKDTLTQRQGEVLSAIESFLAASGYPPSVREVGQLAGISVATAHGHLDELVRKGAILREQGKSRAVRVLSEDWPTCPTCGLRALLSHGCAKAVQR